MEQVVKREILDDITVTRMLKINIPNDNKLKPTEGICLGFAVQKERRK